MSPYMPTLDEHKGSVIEQHMKESYGEEAATIESSFTVLKKCRGKFEGLLFEMLFIRDIIPSLNKQSDSIRAELSSITQQCYILFCECVSLFVSGIVILAVKKSGGAKAPPAPPRLRGPCHCVS